MNVKVLISHVPAESAVAEKIAEPLKNMGFVVRRHVCKAIDPAHSRHRVAAAIAASQHVVTILSSASIDRNGRIRQEIVEACALAKAEQGRQRYLLFFRVEDCEPRRTDVRDVRIIDAIPEFRAAVVALTAAILARPGASEPDRVDDTSWLYMEGGRENAHDEIQFFGDGSTRFKNTGSAYHSVVPYPNVSFTISSGLWSQTDSAVAFTTHDDGTIRCGLIENGVIRSTGNAGFTAMYLRETNKRRIGHELAYDAETDRPTQRYERDGDVVRRRVG